MKNNNTKEAWLRRCFVNWTTSDIQTEAWKFKNDFDGFCKWFLGD